MIISADTNLFLFAANPNSPLHDKAKSFFEQEIVGHRFVLCGLVLVEIYLLLRNPTVFRKPQSAAEASDFCDTLRSNPDWEYVDYEPQVGPALWHWARSHRGGFRQIIDARLALTLRHHGVTHFATGNTRDFQGFGFRRVWNPLAGR